MRRHWQAKASALLSIATLNADAHPSSLARLPRSDAISAIMLRLSIACAWIRSTGAKSRPYLARSKPHLALWRALDDGPFGNVFRLLILTGQRRNEIGKLQWGEIDLARKMIVLPPARTKNSREHCVPLSAQALAIIEGLPRRNTTEFLFGKRGFPDWDGAKARLDERAGIAPWRIHDLRRTCATQMAELGVQPHIIEAVLNHVSGHKGGVAGIYNRARYSDEIRTALQKWADALDKITGHA